MLTNRGIKEKLGKCQTINDMRSPSNVKEDQEITENLVSLSQFLSYASYKVIISCSL